MKHPRLVVSVTALVGLILGVAGGIAWAAMSECDPGDAGSCYGFFGRPFSDTSYLAAIGGLVGFGVGLATGLLIVTAGRLLVRHPGLDSNRDTPDSGSAQTM
jgi:hypothetical protein